MELRAARLNRGDALRITTIKQALSYGDQWQRMYHHLEAAHTLACAQLEASDLLLRLANEELEKIKRIVK